VISYEYVLMIWCDTLIGWSNSCMIIKYLILWNAVLYTLCTHNDMILVKWTKTLNNIRVKFCSSILILCFTMAFIWSLSLYNFKYYIIIFVILYNYVENKLFYFEPLNLILCFNIVIVQTIQFTFSWMESETPCCHLSICCNPSDYLVVFINFGIF
jgi:hypothetical protein